MNPNRRALGDILVHLIPTVLDLRFLIWLSFFSQGTEEEHIELREGSHFTNMKPKILSGRKLPTLRFLYWYVAVYLHFLVGLPSIHGHHVKRKGIFISFYVVTILLWQLF